MYECGGSCRPRPPLIGAPNSYSAKQQCRCVLTRSVACCVVGRGMSPPPYDVGEFPPHSSGNSPTSSPTADNLPQSPPLAIAVSRFRFNRCLVGASHPPRLFNCSRLDAGESTSFPAPYLISTGASCTPFTGSFRWFALLKRAHWGTMPPPPTGALSKSPIPLIRGGATLCNLAGLCLRPVSLRSCGSSHSPESLSPCIIRR